MGLRATIPVIDVRTPAEFAKGHIPGAFNVPLFSNEERVVVGTLYKQVGREEAILKGLDFVGPKMRLIAEEARRIAAGNEVIVHCWRGGMRSGSVAWLLETTGIKTHTLLRGYKAYRTLAQTTFNKPTEYIVLGGYTGSGKTDILKELRRLNQQVIDLENIAHHKGSSFGAIGEQAQTTNEQFENNLFESMLALQVTEPIWIEDESKSIGKNEIPQQMYETIRSSNVIFVDIPRHIRVERLVKEYATCGAEVLREALKRIERRLGGQNLTRAMKALDEADFHTAADISLTYYDKAYLKGVIQRDKNKVHNLNLEADTPPENAQIILEFAQKKGLWKK